MTRARDLAKGTFSGDLTVDTNTLVVDSANNRVGVGTANPTEEIHGYSSGGDFSLKLESASATGTAYTYYKNADRQWATGIRGSVGDSYQIIDSNADTARLVIDTTGAVTMPYQPAFLAIPTGAQFNFPIGAQTTVAFANEIFDQGNNFSSNTFTAPVSGRYQFSVLLYANYMDTATDYYQCQIMTSNRVYSQIVSSNRYTADPTYFSFAVSILVDMDAEDTAYVRIDVSNSGSSQLDLEGTASRFSGYLVC